MDSRIEKLVNQQAEDKGLWFIAVTSSECYLRSALRHLHNVIKNVIAEEKEDKECQDSSYF